MDVNSNAENQATPPPLPTEPATVSPPPLPDEPAQAVPQAQEAPTLPPARAEAEFVEAERMDAGEAGAGGAHRGRVVGIAASGSGRPPRLWAWLFLIAAWLFLSSSAPFTVFIGVPLNLVALVLAAVCLAWGGLFTGIAVLLLGTAGSLAVYLVGWARFLGA